MALDGRRSVAGSWKTMVASLFSGVTVSTCAWEGMAGAICPNDDVAWTMAVVCDVVVWPVSADWPFLAGLPVGMVDMKISPLSDAGRLASLRDRPCAEWHKRDQGASILPGFISPS